MSTALFGLCTYFYDHRSPIPVQIGFSISHSKIYSLGVGSLIKQASWKLQSHFHSSLLVALP